MAVTVKGRTIRKVLVVGSGNIGPDIAQHFAENLGAGAEVVVVDVAPEALERGRARLAGRFAKAVEKGALRPEKAAALEASVVWTSDYDLAAGAGLAVESATEHEEIKQSIFADLDRRLGPEAILASNSSHMEPAVVFARVGDRARTACVHYFYPAERNPVVEVIPGPDTDPDVADFLLAFYERIGKWPIRVRSRYGYSVDPIFEGLCLAALQLVEEGAGSVKEVDETARKALRQGVGPFTAMNLVGGNPIVRHGLPRYGRAIMPWFSASRLLDEQIAAGVPWEVAARGEKVEVPAGRAKRIADDMVAVYAGLAAEVLDSGLVSLADHALAVGTALATASPYDLMNEIGTDRALTLVRSYAERRPGFRVAGALERQGAAGEPWAPPVVLRRNEGDVAILTIRRPDVLNALHSSVLEQIERHVLAIRDDAAIAAVVLTGFGTRAFVAGADIRELATLGNAGAIRRHVQLGHRVLDGIEALGKPVVCAMNGVAFGGGMELALACTTRIAPRGLRALAGQPEPKLGFIPGFGATQRLPRLIGFEAAWTMLRTAEPVSSAVAREIGLVAEEVEGDLLDRAVALAREIAAGRTAPPRPTRGPIPIPDSLPEVDIGPLSRRIDEILRTTVIDGCRLPLPEALRLEIDRIVSCQGTRDMRIGIEHYVRNGPKSPAPFVHA